MNTLIITEGLMKSFGRIQALKGLNLQVRKGVAGFIGPNGSGKTTTINILLGLLKPDAGEATVFGLDSWRKSFTIRRRLGVLHEKPTYPKNFTGVRYLEHVAHAYEMSQPNSRAKKVLKEVGLSEAREKTIKTYSAGMNQRLGLAQALIGEPELVILDEPTANLDPLGRMEIIDKIRELHEDKDVSFFISTHILPELEKVCEWVSIIKDGTIVDQGSMKDLAMKYSANIFRITVSNPNLLAHELRDLQTITKVWVEGGTIYCKANSIDDFYRETPQLLSNLKMELMNFQLLHGTLEEIFKTAIKGEDE